VRIDQWVPALHRGDAIGDSARLMRDGFRSWGHSADVYALDVDDDLVGDGRSFSEWVPGRPEDVLILHFALPSPMTGALKAHAGRRVLLHHNITPPEFFVPYDPEMVRISTVGREELRSLRDHVDLGLGDSELNRRDLEEAGFRRTGVLPILLDFERYRQPPNPVLQRALSDGRTNVLFVGRIAANKRQEDLIRIASYWKRFISPSLRLVLVGKLPRRSTGRGEPLRRHYFDGLQALFYEEGLSPAEVLFLGHVDHDDLLACYATAHLFLSMSEHEGFGVPLVEAMLMGVPILAYRSSAVEHTLGGAGVLFDEKNLAEVGEMAHLLATDSALRAACLRTQARRLPDLSPAAVLARLRGFIESL
jgi:glycosyltransferase involved in cell wall biosynthesis